MADDRHDDWYKGFFAGMALELWREAIPDAVTEEQAEAIADWLEAAPGARLLDIPCGHGRLALELSRRGFAMTGVDLSPAFLEEARAASRAAALAIDWVEADMRAPPPGRTFDGAFCFGNSFGYFDVAGVRAFAQAIADCLRPGGRFVLETAMAAESVLPTLDERIWHPVADMLLVVENHYDVAASRLDSRYIFVRGGRTEERTAHYWIFTAAEIQRLFAAAGLATVALYGGLDGEPFEVGAHQLILVMQKNSERKTP